MKSSHKSWLLALAVTAYAAWQSRDLVNAWQYAPYDRFGWLAFGIWFLPVASAAWIGRLPASGPSSAWLGTGLGLCFVGAIVAMNALTYAGLACVLASYGVGSWKKLFWLLTAVSWMPALGYALKGLATDSVVAVRLVLSLGGAAWLIWQLRKSPEVRA